jgi:putative endonuclease
MKTFYVYILECADKSLYTGVTSNLSQRIDQHNDGIHADAYTYSRRPVRLAYYAEFSDPYIAIEKEKQLKKWSRAKKLALINGEFDLLRSLSKKSFDK